MNIARPSEMQVLDYLNQWDENEEYVCKENALSNLFSKTYPDNKTIEHILVKATTLNNFYSTNIFEVYKVAKHISNLDIDDRLKCGDISLVDDIAMVDMGNKTIRFYSFATKYCSHHNQTEFPIYDSYIEKILKYFRDTDQFYKFKVKDLKDYKKFKNILIEFQRFYNLEKFNLKEIDMYLWQLGKKYYKKNKITQKATIG